MTNFNKLKDLYEDGYRCIYHDSADNNHTIYLKNFNTEGSEVIELTNEEDFTNFQNYVGGLRMS